MTAGYAVSAPLTDKEAMSIPHLPATGPVDGQWARLRVAERLRRRSDLVGAELAARQVYESAVREADQRLAANATLLRGDIRWTAAEYDAAASQYERAFSAEPGPDAELLRWYAGLGFARCARTRNRYHEAQTLAEAALAALDRAGHGPGRADAQRELGTIRLQLDKPDERTEALFSAAREYHAACGDQYLEGLAWIGTGRVSEAREEYAAAEQGYRRALAACEQAGSPEGNAIAQWWLGNLLRRADDRRWEEAEAHLRSALDIYQRYDPLGTAEALLALGSLCAVAGRHAEADDLLRRALAIYTDLGNPVGQHSVHRALARLASRAATAAPDEAGRWLREAREHAATAERIAQGRDLSQLAPAAKLETASVLLPLGAVEQATELVADAVSNLDARGRRGHVRLLLSRAAVQLAMAETGPAQPGTLARSAERLFARAAELAGDDLLTLRAQAQGARAVALRALGETSAALREALAAFRGLEQVRVTLRDSVRRGQFVASNRLVYQLTLDLALEAGDGLAGLEVVEVARTDQLAGLLRHRSGQPLPQELQDVLAHLDTVLVALRRVTGGNPGTLSAGDADPEPAVEQLHVQREQLRRQLARFTAPAFAGVYDPEPADVTTSLAALPAATDLLVLHPRLDDPDRIVTVWVDRGREAHLRQITLTRQEQQITNVLRRDPPELAGVRYLVGDLAPLGRMLPPQLKVALTAAATTGQPRRLLVIPSGGLWSVPVHAVPLSDHTIVAHGATVTFVPSLRVHELLRQAGVPPGTPMRRGHRDPLTGSYQGPRGSLVYGDPAMPTTTRCLTGPATGRLSPRRVITDAVEVAPALRRSGATLMAGLICHGDREPGLAHGLILDAEHRLTAAQLLGADLAPLLVTMACSSGSTPGHEPSEPLGLPTVALTNGVRTIVAALFQILERTASQLLVALLELVAGGTAVDDAHRQVLLDAFDRSGGLDAPLVAWAPLAVIGLPDPIAERAAP